MKILALGIGNVVCADEGVGVHLCRMIEKNYKFTSKEHTLTFVDGGTLAERLIPIIVEYDYMIMFDCVDANDGIIGDVYFFDFDNVPNSISWQGSAHEVEMLQTLMMMDMVGDRPTTKIIGIIPEVISDTTLEMSEPVIKGSALMEKTFLKHISELGLKYEKIANFDIQEVAQSACEREEIV
ncbi:HyaD/HybD family hydrogenase maturation endopeptidase [Sulfurospirillum arcachonense]|uniref:HyaD/HybD family hydrogenase maturation endopeptidase n=1 Tax=Sulfurospirillum arcachonense TaxID=57666 RepID=UPI00046A4C98|nr:HyaD/HybD family hydrogenase maturation endopeptidase [Sulfurospirillum arcachonense]